MVLINGNEKHESEHIYIQDYVQGSSVPFSTCLFVVKVIIYSTGKCKDDEHRAASSKRLKFE